MYLLEDYKKKKRVKRRLIKRILQRPGVEEHVKKTSELLNILRPDLSVETRDERDLSFLMECALFEYRDRGKTLVETYQEEVGGKNLEEREVLEALLSSYTSLFGVNGLSKDNNRLILYDILNGIDSIEILEPMFYQRPMDSLLLFFRLIPYKTFNTTTGIVCAYSRKKEIEILQSFPVLMEKVPIEDPSLQRFIAFFTLFVE